MKTAEVKQMARVWVQREGPKVPGYQGAYLIGSINEKPDESDWPPESDVDITFVLDENDPVALDRLHQVFEVDGLVLDRSASSSEGLQSAQSVLGSPWLACHFAANSVLDDPEGSLSSLHQYVAQHYAERAWVERRCAQVAAGLPLCQEMMLGSRAVPENQLGFSVVVLALAQYLLIAHLQNPTVNKAFVRMKEILAEYGESSLHEDVLQVLGSATMTREEVAAHFGELCAAYPYANSVFQTRFAFDQNITEAVRLTTIAAVQAQIDAGYHREALFPILVHRALCQIAIDYDAPPAEQARYARQYEQLLQALGLATADDYVARAGLAQQTFERIRIAAAAIMDQNSAITA